MSSFIIINDGVTCSKNDPSKDPAGIMMTAVQQRAIAEDFQEGS